MALARPVRATNQGARPMKSNTMSKSCPGTSRALKAAEPDWFKQADEQMNTLYYTLLEINDPGANEAWDNLESAIESIRRIKSR